MEADEQTAVRPTRAPTNKAVAATGGSAVGAALGTLILYGLDPSGHLPTSVASAVTTLVTAAVTLAAAYFTPPGSGEAVLTTSDGGVRTGRAVRTAARRRGPET